MTVAMATVMRSGFARLIPAACCLVSFCLLHGTLVAQMPLAAGFDLDDPPHGLFAEEWMEIRLAGSKIGYGQVTLQRQNDHIITRSLNRFLIARGTTNIELTVEEVTTESLDGNPHSFKHTVTMANQPVVHQGTIFDGTLEYELRQGDYIMRDTVPYPDGALMNWGLLRFADSKGRVPGTRYSINLFSPDISYQNGTPVTVEIGDWDTMDIQGETISVLPVTSYIQIGGRSMETKSYVNEEGQTILSRMEMMGMPIELKVVSQEQAMAEFVPVEMLVSQLVPLNRHIPADAVAVDYIIQHTQGDWPVPHRLPETLAQSVEQDPESGALIVRVRQVNPAEPIPTETSSINPPAEYLESNLMINPDDPLIREKVIRILGEHAAPDWQSAYTLCQFVAGYIEEKNLDVGFASSSEVMRRPEGDCTEHAVLLAAMGRAAGIPARVAMGLWYLPYFQGQQDVMGYHMWTQFFIDEHWLDFDAVSPREVPRPTRIALAVSSLKDDSLTHIGLKLMDQLGQLKIDVAEVHTRPE